MRVCSRCACFLAGGPLGRVLGEKVSGERESDEAEQDGFGHETDREAGDDRNDFLGECEFHGLIWSELMGTT